MPLDNTAAWDAKHKLGKPIVAAASATLFLLIPMNENAISGMSPNNERLVSSNGGVAAGHLIGTIKHAAATGSTRAASKISSSGEVETAFHLNRDQIATDVPMARRCILLGFVCFTVY